MSASRKSGGLGFDLGSRRIDQAQLDLQHEVPWLTFRWDQRHRDIGAAQSFDRRSEQHVAIQFGRCFCWAALPSVWLAIWMSTTRMGKASQASAQGAFTTHARRGTTAFPARQPGALRRFMAASSDRPWPPYDPADVTKLSQRRHRFGTARPNWLDLHDSICKTGARNNYLASDNPGHAVGST